MTYANYADKPPVHFSVPNLAKPHFDHLIAEGFTDADIAFMSAANGVRSISEHEAREMGFSVESGGGLLLPFTLGFAQLRCDNPPIRKGKPCKYLTQSGKQSQAYLPPNAMVVTEGMKDALAGTLRGGVPTGAIAGVSHYRKALPKGCGLTIQFDADAAVNASVTAALVKAAQWCNGKIQLVPEIEGEPKAGLCEYFKAGNTEEDYAKLINSAMTPKQFLLELPNRWANLPVDRIGRMLRTVFSLAVEILDPTSLEVLSKSCKKALKDLEVPAPAIDREYKLAKARTAKKKREARLAEWAKLREEHPEMDLTDVPDGAESNLLKSMRSVKAAVAFDLKLNQLTNDLEFKGHLVDPNTYKLYVAKITDADVPESDCVQILGSIGRKQAYHPVKVWLETLHETYKDSTIEFLDLPSKRYLHTEKPIYDVFLQKQLIAAVARVYQPGCKVDNALIVQGPQGILKSTFLNKLCGDEWFDDNLGSDVENKDELLKLHRCWFQEWGEIDRITSKKELGLVKSFLSRKKDTFRAPYERTAVEHPRSCVIVGSVNPSEFLRDEEDRRLWIIPVSERIDIEALVNDRDKLWAAAVALYKAGHQWHLDADEETELRESNKQFALRDVWEEPIEVWLSLLANTRRRKPDEPIEWVRVQDILVDCLEIKEVKSHTNFDKKRVQEILRRLGWKASDSSVRLPGFTSPQRAWSKAVAPTHDHPPSPTPEVSTPSHVTRGGIPVTIEPETGLWGDCRDLMKVKKCQGEIVDRNVALTDLAPIATPQDLPLGTWIEEPIAHESEYEFTYEPEDDANGGDHDDLGC